jgi:hypothetical protein
MGFRGSTDYMALSAPYLYRLYGLGVRSFIKLPYPEHEGRADVSFYEASADRFATAEEELNLRWGPRRWFECKRLRDGSLYLGWSSVCEFLVPAAGTAVACRRRPGFSAETFHSFLLGQVISFPILHLGMEPLHATVVVIDGDAVAFIGDCGYGKSTLAAAFLREGYPLLTDDLLPLRRPAAGGRLMVSPGPPRIKLTPESAAKLLPEMASEIPINPVTQKQIIPLDEQLACGTPVPLRAIYVLRPPTATREVKQITIRRLSHRRSFVELVRNTYNVIELRRHRLQLQFGIVSAVATSIPVKSLSYPRSFAVLADVCKAVVRDVRGLGRTAEAARTAREATTAV